MKVSFIGVGKSRDEITDILLFFYSKEQPTTNHASTNQIIIQQTLIKLISDR
jgi:hypothetical protein